jgi:hypothetical protein
VSPQKRVPQVGIEFDLLGVRSAFHVDASQPVVPYCLRCFPDSVEIPAGTLGIHVAASIFNACVGYGKLYPDFIPGFYLIACGGAGCRGIDITVAVRMLRKHVFFSGQRPNVGQRFFVVPSVKLLKRLVETDDKEDADIVRPAPQASGRINRAFQFGVADSGQLRVKGAAPIMPKG